MNATMGWLGAPTHFALFASMWPRKQIDISWRDLAYGLIEVLLPHSRPAPPPGISGWISHEETILTLSVRSGWDLLLASLQLPHGSELLISAVTIPDMVRIAEHHGLVPVPIDVDVERLEPNIDALQRAISPRSRAILIAHLFGARVDMEPIHQLARQHNLLVIEDCAQAFVGRSYAGHAETHCTMFSFGPIKTATALGGAVLRVRDRELFARMKNLQRSYPLQSGWSYFKRLVKFAMLRLVGQPTLYGAFVRFCQLFGINYDRRLSNAAHSFERDRLLPQLRQRPCRALERTLNRTLATFNNDAAARLRRRAARGRRLAETLPAGMVAGGRNPLHSFWATPIVVANPQETIATLRAARFDATTRSSLAAVRAPCDPSKVEPPRAQWLADTVFLPDGDGMPESEWQRMVTEIIIVAKARATESPEPVASELVSRAS